MNSLVNHCWRRYAMRDQDSTTTFPQNLPAPQQNALLHGIPYWEHRSRKLPYSLPGGTTRSTQSHATPDSVLFSHPFERNGEVKLVGFECLVRVSGFFLRADDGCGAVVLSALHHGLAPG